MQRRVAAIHDRWLPCCVRSGARFGVSSPFVAIQNSIWSHRLLAASMGGGQDSGTGADPIPDRGGGWAVTAHHDLRSTW